MSFSTLNTIAQHIWIADPNYTFSGIIEKEAHGFMEVVIDNVVYRTDIDASGNWSWQLPAGLQEGEHTIAFRVVDRTGRTGKDAQRILHLDTTAPEQPEILKVYDNQGSLTGNLTSGDRTDDRTPTLSGVAEPGSKVTIYDNGVRVTEVTADARGKWTYEPTLEQGQHVITVTATDRLGHTSAPSEPFTLTVGDDRPGNPDPNAADILFAMDDAGVATGKLTSGALTDDSTPELHGYAPVGSTVTLQYRQVGSGVWTDVKDIATDANGNWQWSAPALAEGKFEFRVNAGSGWSNEFNLTINPSPEADISITHAYDNYGPFTGILGSGAMTDDMNPQLHGRAEANSLVYVHYRLKDGTFAELGSVRAAADGSWVLDTDRLAPASYEFVAGNSKTANAAAQKFALELVTAENNVPRIVDAWDDFGRGTGSLKSGDFTDDFTPTLRGKAEANSIVIIKYQLDGNGTLYSQSVNTDKSGNWSFTPANLPASGVWNFTAATSGSLAKSPEFSLSIAKVESDLYDFNDESNRNLSKKYTYKNITLESDNYGGFIRFQDKKLSVDNIDLTSWGYYTSHLNIFMNVDVYEFRANVYWDKNGSDYKAPNGSLAGHFNTWAQVYYNDGTYEYISASSYTQEISVSRKGTTIKSIKFANLTSYNLQMTVDNIELIYINQQASNIQSQDIIDDAHDLSAADRLSDSDEKALSTDTLILTGKDQHLNLGDLATKFTTETAIDITGSGDNTLSVTLGDILAYGGKDLFIADGKTQFMVKGDAGDVVEIQHLLGEQGTEAWHSAGQVTVGGIAYQVFEHADREAELLVQQGVMAQVA